MLSFQQKDNESSHVKDTMNHDYEFNGNCRKRRYEINGEDTSRKRQRRDQTTNLDTGNNHRDAGLMVHIVYMTFLVKSS